MGSGQLSLYGANALLGMAFGQTVTPPANYYFAITTIIPAPDMDGSTIAAYEPPRTSGSGDYSRLTIPNSTTFWNASANAPYVLNAQTGFWPSGTVVGASADWPICTGWALVDAQTGGNLWAVGTLANQVAIPNGFCAYLNPGALSIELSPFFSVKSN
jgi:hypothetical protein